MRRQQIAAPRCGSETLLGRTDSAGILGQARRLGVTAWEQAMDAMREDDDMRAGEAARIEQANAEGYRYLGALNPLKHRLPDVMKAEQVAANKVRQEGSR